MPEEKDTYIVTRRWGRQLLVTKPRLVLQMFLAGSAVFGILAGMQYALGVHLVTYNQYPVGAWWVAFYAILSAVCALLYVGFLVRHAEESIPERPE